MYTNPCLVTPSGNLVACNGDKFLCTRRDLLYESLEEIDEIPHIAGLICLNGILNDPIVRYNQVEIAASLCLTNEFFLNIKY